MNSTNNCKTSVISIRAIVWELLGQWKAILIIAVLVALLVPGLKYARDTISYKQATANQEEVENQDILSADEKITAVLDSLSASDRSDVEFVIEEKAWIKTQREYLKKSICLNNNPTNQRTLLIEYQLHSPDPGNMPALIYSYSSCIYNDTLLSDLGEIIAPDLDRKYIAELIKCDTERVKTVELETSNMVIEFQVILPEDINAASVEQVLTVFLNKTSNQFSSAIGNNSISHIATVDYRRYNTDAVNNRTNINYAIYNVQNNIKNSASSLSDEARAAIEKIDEIQAQDAIASDKEKPTPSTEPAAPHFSKKYALLGFILGVCAYAFIYALLVILKGNMTSAGDFEYYTGSRLLGEVYRKASHTGINALLHSGIVDGIRYKGKLDEQIQVEKLISSLEAVSKHAETDRVSLLCMPGLGDADYDSVVRISSDIAKKGVASEVVKIDETIDENQLMSAQNCVIVGGNGTKVAGLQTLVQLCKEYGIKQLGDIYIQGI